jgi:hypothetical protein
MENNGGQPRPLQLGAKGAYIVRYVLVPVKVVAG